MNDKIIFGKWETAAITINAMSLQVFLNFPRSMVEVAGTAAWIVTVYITLIGFILFTIIARLLKAFEGWDLVDIGEYVGGSVLRVVVGLLIMFHITFIISNILREFAEDMKVIALTNSPISFVTFFFLAAMVFGAYMGIEAIVRFGVITVPFILGGLVLILLGVTPQYNVLNLAPIFGSGLYDIFGSGALRVSSYSALILLFMMYPFVRKHDKFRGAGYIAIGVTSLNFIVSVLAYSMAFPHQSAVESFLPIYQLARIINLGRFFQRIEPVFVLIWAASAMLYLSLGFFMIAYVFKKTFKLPYYRPLIMPFAILVFTISLLPQNLMTAVDLEVVYFRSYAWLVTFLMPIVLLLIARIIKEKKKKEEANA